MSNSTPDIIDIKKIMGMLPHRYPFLLVDRVEEITPGESIRAYKNVTMNEPFFQGHFPGLPVMPGVLIVEALAQAGGIIVLSTDEVDTEDKVFLFTGINKVKFRRPVVPGDKLVLEISDVKRKMHIWKMKCVATVDGEVAAQGEVSAAIVDKESM
ncbi:3-hydroxyacyl-ACP dehydratase FabZ [Maridesulfovibrio salexigens]|uniref:3-hydroxyacyl-[acyl-carrier-protein] dehydratase FabZ n=1 Tax=Maridesulfovibrio salexigens (strain ATCC 14822 / DSM 2638 / NCIMB 8403 / VKM B-1763) TaxID=526222 RepID=C6BY47_MARSD|nr:3-hydroxyacyl-ACP dehydratase FabZ [Maridesulfovibrio salexigens]ACS80577.1 beta-hydroxyacyl-(acyl-carrier-protein) dehydratase FabZ [Maridesulfovibrio salexigens DSM 2638]